MRTDLHPIDALGERLAELAAQIDSATHQFLTDLRAFDVASGWHRQGAVSCAHWLSWRCGIDLGAAREKVRVARALGQLPKLDDALRRGQVSFSKVRALTRVATPENEETLLSYARTGTAAQIEKVCRLFRQAQPRQPAAAAAAPEEARHVVRVRETDDGMVSIEARLTPEEAALVLAAIDSAGEKGAKQDRAANLVALAEERLRGDAPARPPVEVVVHVDAETLAGHLPDGSGVSAETSRRLLCDAGVVPVLEKGGEVLDVGRRTRTIPGALRRALQARDQGCRFPGCSNRIVDAHHLVHWADGGETKLDNLLQLCRRHHGLLHEGGFAVSGTPETGLVFLDPSGKPIPPAGPPVELPSWGVEPLREAARARGVEIEPETNLPDWDGRTPDYAWAVEDLCLRAVAARA